MKSFLLLVIIEGQVPYIYVEAKDVCKFILYKTNSYHTAQPRLNLLPQGEDS